MSETKVVSGKKNKKIISDIQPSDVQTSDVPKVIENIETNINEQSLIQTMVKPLVIRNKTLNTTKISGILIVNHNDGTIYFNDSRNNTILRIYKLPNIPTIKRNKPLTIDMKYGPNWMIKNNKNNIENSKILESENVAIENVAIENVET